jgi:hypothetical protein
LRLPAPLAAQRRRRAKARARPDRSLCPSQRYLKLLDWTILLTRVFHLVVKRHFVPRS